MYFFITNYNMYKIIYGNSIKILPIQTETQELPPKDN